MASSSFDPIVLSKLHQQFEQEGYTIVQRLFTSSEVQELLDTMTNIHAAGPIPALNYRPLSALEAGDDILKHYPRIIHPHKVNNTAMRYMLHPKLMAVLAILFDEEPLAAQSMFYFKPAGARGQSLHQDNFFLKVEPGTCIAAWIALDPADEGNGGLVVVPETNNLDIQCHHAADTRIFFTNEEVDIPEGRFPIPVTLNSGDVLFFNGSIIHGSYPNTSKERWRRSFICHYVGASTLRIGSFYNELYKASAEMVKREENTDAGPCGSVSSEPH